MLYQICATYHCLFRNEIIFFGILAAITRNMHPLYDRIKQNYKFGTTILLFVITFLILAYLMPRERKFTYNFQERRPWKEDNLTAPFDFSILKTNAELQAERDSVLAEVKPFFSFNANVASEQLNKFKDNFSRDWIAYSVKAFNISSEDEYRGSKKYAFLREMQEYYTNLLSSLLEKTYVKGIIEIPEGDSVYTPNAEIVLLRGNIADEINLSEIYTLKTAYEQIMLKINEDTEYKNNWYRNKFNKFFENYEIDRYIVPDVLFDKAASERERNQRLNEISIKKGRIQRGELIVANGQIITQDINQVLVSLKAAYDDQLRNVNTMLVLTGKLIFVFFVLVLIYVFLYNFRKELLRDVVKTALSCSW